jgi:murein L,D-transpeptidase YcbB/YkuD
MEQWKHQTKTWTQNPMGLVKFMFPNSNAIYLHDTPYKSLFEFDYRAFKWVYQYGQSQGTGINSKEDLNWTVEAINEAMKGQTIHIPTNEIPVHIRYFTVWVDDIERSIL